MIKSYLSPFSSASPPSCIPSIVEDLGNSMSDSTITPDTNDPNDSESSLPASTARFFLMPSASPWVTNFAPCIMMSLPMFSLVMMSSVSVPALAVATWFSRSTMLATTFPRWSSVWPLYKSIAFCLMCLGTSRPSIEAI
ncbi:hypothetical protein SDC9_182106 [bioreactor metagenome]|uniref:Uncharacterized protein n=1 Tax=bioreactor metagenome TaxID=1076179 RepID=A0A645H8B8_9ZZZZ